MMPALCPTCSGETTMEVLKERHTPEIIRVRADYTGFQASAGQVRLITGWRPQAQDLKPLLFTCQIPDTVDPRGRKGK